MHKPQAQKRIEELSRVLEEHNHRYYVLSQPTISDKEYDDLLKELISLEQIYPQWRKDTSPSTRVGVKQEGVSENVWHRQKMYSLDNSYSINDLKIWHTRVCKGLAASEVTYVVELKIDGVSASLTYENGALTVGATRGDGMTGEDVTANIKTIKNIPLELNTHVLSAPTVMEVRGEVYMRHSDFQRLNHWRKKNGENLFANPRNSASGSLKLLDSRLTAQRNLQCFIHSPGFLDGEKIFQTQWEFLEAAEKYGFAVNSIRRLCIGIDEVIAFCQAYQLKRADIPYDVDGVVVKVNDFKDQERLGATQKSPRWAIAFKFDAYQVTTQVMSIDVQVGRTGVLTPVANLTPAVCGGVTIARATLHNFDEIQRLGVCLGCRVLVERAGDVIPKIIKVVSSPSGLQDFFQAPQKCPVCGADVVKPKDDQVAFRCPNGLCPAQLQRAVLHFASRKAMDIEGLGERIVEQLLERGLIKDLADIYKLQRIQLMTCDLFKEKKADNLLAAIEKSRTQPLSRFLFGLGIATIGEKAAATLARRFKNLDNIQAAVYEDFLTIKDFGPVMAESLVAFFKIPASQALIKKFKESGVDPFEGDQDQLLQTLVGRKFVFTGELEGLNRQEAKARVEALGGEVLAALSAKVDYLVAGASAGSKMLKAKDLGIKIIDEKEFLGLCG